MAATIKIKNSSTAGAAPTSSDLVQGELAVNVTDKRLYTENSGGTIVELGTNPSVPVTFPDGSASAPSLTNDGDTNTGLFFPAADTVGITTGGTERARFDSSGNMGLGVTPSAWSGWGKVIDFGSNDATIAGGGTGGYGVYFLSNTYYNAGYKYKTTSAAAYYQQITGQHIWYNAPSGTAGNAISFTQAMTLDASGNLGVGTTSPASRVDVSSASTGVVKFTSGKSGWLYADSAGIALSDTSDFTKNGLYINNTSNYVAVYTGSTGAERARIDSSGNLLVGTTSTVTSGGVGFAVQTDGSGSFIARRTNTTSSNTVAYWYNPNGNVGSISTSGSATGYNTSSDYRLKENIQPMTGALAKVAALKPCTYKWKADGSDGEGFIAHELAEVVPQCVTGEKDAVDADGNPQYQGIDTSFLVATLVAAIQELKAEVDALKGTK